MSHAVVLATVLAAPQQAPEPLEGFLRTEMRLGRSDFNALTSGAPVVRRLRTADNREIAFVGIVRIETDQGEFRRRLDEIDPLLRIPEFSAFGRIEDPADASLRGLVLPRQDLEKLATCRPAACDVKLPRDAMERAAGLDASAPEYHRRALELFRDELEAYLAAYAARGADALMVYADKPAPASTRTALAYLARQRPSLEDLGVGAARDGDGPRPGAGSSDGAGDARARPASRLFWTIGESGAQPVTQIDELLVEGRSSAAGPVTVATIRQLYASHYYEGQLTRLILFPPRPGDERRGAWLVYFDRSLFDGEVGGLRRAYVLNRFEHAVTSRLRWYKTILEER